MNGELTYITMSPRISETLDYLDSRLEGFASDSARLVHRASHDLCFLSGSSKQQIWFLSACRSVMHGSWIQDLTIVWSNNGGKCRNWISWCDKQRWLKWTTDLKLIICLLFYNVQQNIVISQQSAVVSILSHVKTEPETSRPVVGAGQTRRAKNWMTTAWRWSMDIFD